MNYWVHNYLWSNVTAGRMGALVTDRWMGVTAHGIDSSACDCSIARCVYVCVSGSSPDQ